MGGMSTPAKRAYARELGIPRDYDDWWHYREFWRDDLPLRTRLQYVDFHTFMPGLVLTKVDRTSMAVSLEARVPLLARRIIEFSFGLDEDLRFYRRRAERLAAARLPRHPARSHSRPPQEGFRHSALLLEGRQRRPVHSRARLAKPVSGSNG